MVIGRFAGTVSITCPSPSVLSTATGSLPSGGNHLEAGSLIWMLVSSTSCMMPTPTMGFVIEAIAKIASFGIGVPACLSR